MKDLHELFFRFPKEFPLPFLLDGATGTNLIAAGMPGGVCPEEWILSHPDVLTDLQKAYRKAGSDGVTSPTFGANGPALERYGTADVEKTNKELLALSKASGALVGGDIGPTGCFLEPFGDKTAEEMTAIFAGQAKALDEAGADYFSIETMTSLSEARCAVRGVRSVSDKPVFVSMSFEESGYTMSGDDPLCCLLTLAEEGISAFGANCSLGPQVVSRALEGLLPYALSLGVALIAKPNAGLPDEREGGTVYPLAPAGFADWTERFLADGFLVLGGCCGTTPAHIAAAKDVLSKTPPVFPTEKKETDRLLCTSRSVALRPEKDGEFVLFGEDTDLSECGGEVAFLDVPDGEAGLFLSSLYLLNVPCVVRCSEETKQKLQSAFCGKAAFVVRTD